MILFSLGWLPFFSHKPDLSRHLWYLSKNFSRYNPFITFNLFSWSKSLLKLRIRNKATMHSKANKETYVALKNLKPRTRCAPIPLQTCRKQTFYSPSLCFCFWPNNGKTEVRPFASSTQIKLLCLLHGISKLGALLWAWDWGPKWLLRRPPLRAGS